MLAFLYLVGPGSVLAYTAYVWLLGNAPLSTATTYAYVNPVVAVLLGWAVLSEPVTATALAPAPAAERPRVASELRLGRGAGEPAVEGNFVQSRWAGVRELHESARLEHLREIEGVG